MYVTPGRFSLGDVDPTTQQDIKDAVDASKSIFAPFTDALSNAAGAVTSVFAPSSGSIAPTSSGPSLLTLAAIAGGIYLLTRKKGRR